MAGCGPVGRIGLLAVAAALLQLAQPASVGASPWQAWTSQAALSTALAGPAGPPAGPSGTAAAASRVQATARRELQGLDTGTVQLFVDRLHRELGPGSGFAWSDLERVLAGQGLGLRPRQLVDALLRIFLGQVRSSLRVLGQLLVLVVFSSLLRQMQTGFEAEAVARVADAAVLVALVAVGLVGFGLVIRLAQGTIADLSGFMLALLPALVGLLVASGAPATAGLLHPLLIGTVNAVAVVVRTAILPLLLLACLLDVASALAPGFRLTSLSSLIRQLALGGLGLLLTVFFGVVAVQGAAGAVADGVALRAAKYAAKTFVPVVGALLADAAEVVLTSSLLLRSGLGLLGLLTVALLVAVPVMKMMALWAVYRVSAGIAQPVGSEGLVQVLSGIAGTLGLLTLAVSAVGLMCFLSLAVLVGAGGVALALR